MHSKEAAGCRLCRYRRVQEKRPDRDCLNGEVTVYLTLTFVLFVSLILALVESASVQMAKNYRRADMNRALECVFERRHSASFSQSGKRAPSHAP